MVVDCPRPECGASWVGICVEGSLPLPGKNIFGARKKRGERRSKGGALGEEDQKRDEHAPQRGKAVTYHELKNVCTGGGECRVSAYKQSTLWSVKEIWEAPGQPFIEISYEKRNSTGEKPYGRRMKRGGASDFGKIQTLLAEEDPWNKGAGSGEQPYHRLK